MSSWAVGSSTSMSEGWAANARASMRRWASPPDSSANLRSVTRVRLNRSMSVRACSSASRRGSPLASRGRLTWSIAVRWATPCGFWKIQRIESIPCRVTWPSAGVVQPAMMPSSVDLPAPLGPVSAYTCPGMRLAVRSWNRSGPSAYRWPTWSRSTRIAHRLSRIGLDARGRLAVDRDQRAAQ